MDELEKSGFSPRFGYIINSVFQILPQMLAARDVIADAQRSRGMETEGNMLVRIKAFLPLISPVVMSSLINTRTCDCTGGTRIWQKAEKNLAL